MDKTSDDTPESLRQRIAELEGQVAALRTRLTARAENLQEILPKFYREEEVPATSTVAEAPVDLVLTARDAYDFLVPCLESVIENTDIPFRLFLNDDASRDPRVYEYFLSLRERVAAPVRVFQQRESLGFPDAVNMMLAETENDVVVVNSDTVLPPGWAARLLWPIRHSGERVASSSPFTNSTMMGSFPYPRRDNELLPGLDTAATDRILRLVRPTAEWGLPWSPGFCLALSRKALSDVGLLDADTFRPGYGEDADWGHRAGMRGWRNVLAANVFVYHKQGVSFKRTHSAEREALLARGLEILTRRYPGCIDKIYEFNDDPDYLAFASFLLFLAGCRAGGGLAVQFVPFGKAFPETERPEIPSAKVARDPTAGEYHIHFAYLEHRAHFTSPNINWVLKALYRVKILFIDVRELPHDDDGASRQGIARLAAHFGVAPSGLSEGD